MRKRLNLPSIVTLMVLDFSVFVPAGCGGGYVASHHAGLDKTTDEHRGSVGIYTSTAFAISNKTKQLFQVSQIAGLAGNQFLRRTV